MIAMYRATYEESGDRFDPDDIDELGFFVDLSLAKEACRQNEAIEAMDPYVLVKQHFLEWGKRDNGMWVAAVPERYAYYVITPLTLTETVEELTALMAARREAGRDG